VAVLEKVYAPDDPVLLQPLQVLTVIRFEQGKTARAREAVKKMQSIRVERPQDRALVHGIVASLLYTEHQRPQAEAEYLACLRAWEEAGRGNTADAGQSWRAGPYFRCEAVHTPRSVSKLDIVIHDSDPSSGGLCATTRVPHFSRNNVDFGG
jgi:hypothetical protein